MRRILLSVAGFDPSSGAGASLDLHVFRQLGFFGAAVLTSLTAQNSLSVKKVHPLPPEFVHLQFTTIVEDLKLSGVKVGMIGSGNNIPVIAEILSQSGNIPKVVDPIFRSSSGAWLLEMEAIPDYIKAISGKATLLTPNLEESSLITGERVENLDEMKEAARRIWELTQIPCLIKGGHLHQKAADILFDGEKFQIFQKIRIKKDVHGTGCFLSSAILCFLAKEKSLPKACLLASQTIENAIRRSQRLGKGRHFFHSS